MRLKGSLFQFLSTFDDCATFFSNIFCLQRVPPSNFFLIFCSKLKCQEARRVSSFKYFGTMRRLFCFFFRKFMKFFLSPRGPPFIFFIFCNKLDFQRARRVPPFTIFKNLRFLSLRYSADFRLSRLVLFCGPQKCVLQSFLSWILM